MPLAKVMPRMLAVALLALAGASCASDGAASPQLEAQVVAADPPPSLSQPPPVGQVVEVSAAARMPSSIRNGLAEMVLQAVEPTVSREEVAAAIQQMVFNAPACLQMPALWLEPSDRPNVFNVRFDLMARDWGQPAADAAGARLDEFVTLGFITKRDRPSVGPGVIEITLTPDGRAHLRGRMNPGIRSNFCGPGERRLVEITSIEFGRFPCGTLRVHFTHVAEDWPSWARGNADRARAGANWPMPGESGEGTVSLNRQWYRADALPAGFQNGSLQSLCYERERRVADNDLDLTVARPPEP